MVKISATMATSMAREASLDIEAAAGVDEEKNRRLRTRSSKRMARSMQGAGQLG